MFVTVNELVGLPGLPTTQQGLRYSLNKVACNSPELVRKRSGSKAFEYHIDCLPEQVREIIRERHYREILQQDSDDSGQPSQRVNTTTRDELKLLRQCPALLEREVGYLTEKQKEIADARATLALYVEKLRDAGMSRTAAVNYVSLESRKGRLPAHLLKAAELSRQCPLIA
ncbi:DNA-binding protein [Phytobacter sp. V91]|uniref:DNA-binding protein n=1 Tax=Phytobacter sp. V91 TaxID=3369425 RepID=UPI003F5F87CE